MANIKKSSIWFKKKKLFQQIYTVERGNNPRPKYILLFLRHAHLHDLCPFAEKHQMMMWGPIHPTSRQRHRWKTSNICPVLRLLPVRQRSGRAFATWRQSWRGPTTVAGGSCLASSASTSWSWAALWSAAVPSTAWRSLLRTGRSSSSFSSSSQCCGCCFTQPSPLEGIKRSCSKTATRDLCGSEVRTLDFSWSVLEECHSQVVVTYCKCLYFSWTCAVWVSQSPHGHLQDCQLCGLPSLWLCC